MVRRWVRGGWKRLGVFEVMVIVGCDGFEGDKRVACIELDEPHALRIAAEHRNLARTRAHQRATGTHEHELVRNRDLRRRHEPAVAIARLHSDDALAPAT